MTRRSVTAADIARFEATVPGVVNVGLTRRIVTPAVALAILACTVWGLDRLGFSLARLIDGTAKLGWLISFMIPPSHGGWFAEFLYALAETVAMALLATVFASLIALPLGFLCARTMMRIALVRWVLRRVLDVVRGVDALIWALIFVNVVGLGPFAGVLALTIHNAGDLAKLYSEAIENLDRREIEGVKASAGGPLAIMRFGVLPQVLPNLLSQSLYYFESNTRSATIIGAVGAGGIGLLLTERIRHNLWSEVAFLIIMILVAVFVIDLLSKSLREAFIHGGPPAPLVTVPAETADASGDGRG